MTHKRAGDFADNPKHRLKPSKPCREPQLADALDPVCNKDAHSHGLCIYHYQQRRRRGMPMPAPVADTPTEKLCLDCGLVKPLSEFSRISSYADRYRPNCKPCRVVESRKYREANLEKVTAYQKQWHRDHPEKMKAYAKKSNSRPEAKAKAKARQLEWIKTHPGQRGAKRAVQWALEEGELIRPDACDRCEKVGPLHAHHYRGYHPTHWLDVEWLCPRCHYFANREPKPDHYL